MAKEKLAENKHQQANSKDANVYQLGNNIKSISGHDSKLNSKEDSFFKGLNSQRSSQRSSLEASIERSKQKSSLKPPFGFPELWIAKFRWFERALAMPIWHSLKCVKGQQTVNRNSS